MDSSMNDRSWVQGRTSAKWRMYEPDVLPMWIAEMDFPLAEPITRALHRAVETGDVGYRWAAGLPESLSRYAADRWEWQVDPESVMVLGDVLTGVAEAISYLTKPGESIVINTPVYPPFFSTVTGMCKRTIVEVPLAGDVQSGYSYDLEALEQAFSNQTVTGYLLCNPHNPAGLVLSRSEARRIAELAEEYNVAVIADEIHAPLTLGDAVHTPYLSEVPENARAVSVTSASKAWNLPGLKCAQMVSRSVALHKEFASHIPMEIQYGAGHLGVIAGIAAFDEGQEWLDEVCATVQSNVQLVHELIAELPFHATYPDATYLVWLDCRDAGLGHDPAAAFLERGRVALSSGLPFGSLGRGHARLNIGTTPERVAEAVRRMSLALD